MLDKPYGSCWEHEREPSSSLILTHKNYRQQFECLVTRFGTVNFTEQQVVHTRIPVTMWTYSLNCYRGTGNNHRVELKTNVLKLCRFEFKVLLTLK